MSRTPLSCAALLLAALCACGVSDVGPASELSLVPEFGTNPGNLLMYARVPPGTPAGAPLVLVLHGCTQSAADMEASGWTDAARAYGFSVVYAQQQASNNNGGCFNWFSPADTARGAGEAHSLQQMVEWMKSRHGVDSSRVFVVGLSAGAFMAAALLAAYPDVFAGGAVIAGGPFGCATTPGEALTCTSPGPAKTPAEWGALARSAFPGYSGLRPRVSLWHGAGDLVVAPKNLTESVEQWTEVQGIDSIADLHEEGPGYTHSVYRDSSGLARVETYLLTGVGHAVAVDTAFTFPGSDRTCGAPDAYFVDTGLCSTYRQARFFGLAP